jgi:excisionase family DNA binding protein
MCGMKNRAASSPTDPVARERWLDSYARTAEIAQMLSISEDTVRRLIRAGRLKARRLGERAIGVRRRDVLLIDHE